MHRLFAIGSAVFIFAFAAVPAFAAGHLHDLTTGSGTVSVGPDACAVTTEDGLYEGFLNFHDNVHRGVPGTTAFANEANPVSIAFVSCPT